MLRFVPKQQEKRQIPPELASLDVPCRLLELLIDRGIDTKEKIENTCIPSVRICMTQC